jgi:uncharacterized protein (TIGR02145 family)
LSGSPIRVNAIAIAVKTLSDADGNVYQAVTIGTQTWMAENLKTTKYNDGTNIPAEIFWIQVHSPAYCWYDDDDVKYKDLYGALYNLYAVETEKICPTGWHVPSDDEWITLETYITNDGVLGSERTALKATSGWNRDNNGTDNYGFTALPGGYRSNYDGSFSSVGDYAYWWSSTHLGSENA